MKGNLLRAKIVEKGMTVDSLCSKAGFVRSTFDRKLFGQTPFNCDEVGRIIEALDLSEQELVTIFFPNYVAENSNKQIAKDD